MGSTGAIQSPNAVVIRNSKPAPAKTSLTLIMKKFSSMGPILVAAGLAVLAGPAGGQTVTDIGASLPIPGAGDISSFGTPNPSFGTDEKPGGMNYYDDNGSGLISPAQTFLSLTNGVLTSVAYQMGNNSGTYAGSQSGTGPGLMRLRVYQLAGSASTTATLLAEYNSDPNFTFSASDWLQWTGIAVRVTNGVEYAYSISSGLNNINHSQMYCRVYCIPNNLYSNGSICLIQAAGGASSVTYNAVANNYDQNFDLGFSDLSVLNKPLAPAPSVSPGTTLYGGSPFTLEENATGANLHYQWQTDGGAGSLTNIPGATGPSLTQVAPSSGVSSISYDVIVTNLNGAVTSPVVQITLNPPSAPLLDADLDNLAPATYAGGSLSFSASFSGTLPISYQWMTNSGSGEHPLVGATNSSLTLGHLPLSWAGTVRLAAVNALGSNSTSTATITVLPDPPAPAPAEPYAFAVYGNHPLAYWRFSEVDATTAGGVPAYDSSGHGYDASYGVGASDNAQGPQAPAFPGFESANTGVQLPGPNTVGHGYLIAPDLNLNTNTATFTA